MIQIPANNLLEEIIKLTPEQRIFVDFPKDVCNRLELLGQQIQSAESLFKSYINNTSEAANELNMSKFLTLYTELSREKDVSFKDTVLRLLGTEVYNYSEDKSNKIVYYLDFNLKKLVIRQGLLSIRS